MTRLALQRVMVRMLYDPTLVDRVTRDAGAALAEVGLTEQELDWLRTPDPRAWKVDPERPIRSLNILLQQYPAATALAVRACRGAEPLLRYFGSARFHRTMQQAESMAFAFGDHLADLTASGEVADSRVAPLARLEQSIVALHRSIRPWPPALGAHGVLFTLSPDKALHLAPVGTADLHESIHVLLGGARMDLAQAVLQPPGPLPDLAIELNAKESLLLELARDDGPRVKYGVATAEITGEFHALLTFAASPRSYPALTAETARLGADPADAEDIVAGMIEDGTLVPVSALHSAP